MNPAGPEVAALSAKALRARILAGIAAGRPLVGPSNVHVDVTNGCNAACITCWDHSPLLAEGRPAAWKRRRLPLSDFRALVEDLAGLGSVRAVVLSGMGEPLTHPDIYEMIGLVKPLYEGVEQDRMNDLEAIAQALGRIFEALGAAGLSVVGLVPSPIFGGRGALELLAWIKEGPPGDPSLISAAISEAAQSLVKVDA